MGRIRADVLTAGRHLLSLITCSTSPVGAGRMEPKRAPSRSRKRCNRSRCTRSASSWARSSSAWRLIDQIVVEADSCIRRLQPDVERGPVTPQGGRVDVSAKVVGDVVESRSPTRVLASRLMTRADLRRVPPGTRRERRSARRRHRARSPYCPQVHRATRRAPLGRERARQGQHLPVHASRQAGHVKCMSLS